MTSPQTIDAELTHLRTLKRLHENLQNLAQSATMELDILREVHAILGTSHIVFLSYNATDASLEYSQAIPKPTGKPAVFIATFNAEEGSMTKRLTSREVIVFDTGLTDLRLTSLAQFMNTNHGLLLPLKYEEKLIGLLAAYNSDDTSLNPETVGLAQALVPSLIGLFELAKKQSDTQKRMEAIARETEIFSRIDEELADIIDLNYVFTMLKDWALRFSNADAASLSLYDAELNSLRIMSHYGYPVGAIQPNHELTGQQGGITLRVARSGIEEIVPDLATDPDYYELARGMRTQMSVPIKREERVIAVLNLLSTHLNGFTEEHLEFVKRLANRGGVAVDNARLFAETTREREKLQYVVQNIGDNIIVLGLDNHIILINDAAIQAFHLSADTDYTGKLFNDAISHQKLQLSYQLAIETQETSSVELELPNGRTYHTKIEYHKNVGRIIVMQDISRFKETERLKTELVATVSHDLKQPLSVMRGYLDLLQMVNQFDKKSLGYIDNLNYAFNNMRQLIDDLLDIARIEAGIKLDLEQVNIIEILNRAIRNNQHLSEQKKQNIKLEIPENLPSVSGDPSRLEQIFNNLVSNAVKYTPPEGKVRVYAELKQDAIRIFVEDSGLGIGAEDQAQIFERFYRVRRPETDSIEGTGLGLAIVKSLVEAHQGKIDLKSALGEGSTFRVTLPLQ
jgi:two-component system, OmpR family, phosphate regulon sensor histidine kinase PhoR